MKKRMNKIISLITKNKRKVVLLTIILLMVFTSTFIYINLTNPTKINSLIASVVNKGAPANKAFEDDIFYKVVVDAYNKENETSLPYTTSLTDEQLRTITSISYSDYGKPSDEKIISAKGLEKLTNLTYLSLYDTNLSTIDLSNNTNLTDLNLARNNLSTIDLSNNTNLTDLNLANNNLSTIDLSNNTKLTHLRLYNTNLSTIDLSNNTKLTYLDLTSNNLSEIDVSNNYLLEYLNVSYNNIYNLNVENNKELLGLAITNTYIRSIDISKNIKLKGFSAGYYTDCKLDMGAGDFPSGSYSTATVNYLTKLDTSNNTELEVLSLYNNDIDDIDVSENTALKYLRIDDNNLSSIDLSKNTLLKTVHISNNNLSNIILNPTIDINVIKNQNSNQKLVDLGNDKQIQPIDEYYWYINQKIVIPTSEELDLFIENLGLENLSAKIYSGEEEKKSGQIKNGDILKIYDGETEIQNLTIEIFMNSKFKDENFYKAVINAYNNINNTNLPYTTSLDNEQLETITRLSSSNAKIKNVYGI